MGCVASCLSRRPSPWLWGTLLRSDRVSAVERQMALFERRGTDLKTVDGIAEIQGVKGAWFKDPDGNILAIGERT
jgi:hypothetical protein